MTLQSHPVEYSSVMNRLCKIWSLRFCSRNISSINDVIILSFFGYREIYIYRIFSSLFFLFQFPKTSSPGWDVSRNNLICQKTSCWLRLSREMVSPTKTCMAAILNFRWLPCVGGQTINSSWNVFHRVDLGLQKCIGCHIRCSVNGETNQNRG